MSIVPFPLPKGRALELIRKVALDTGRVVIPDPPTTWGEFRRVVNHRQVVLCLQDGEIIGGPTLDQFGNWRCVLRRVSVGVLVEVTASLYNQNNEWWVAVTEVRTT